MKHKKLIIVLSVIIVVASLAMGGCLAAISEDETKSDNAIDLPDTPQAIDLDIYAPVRSAMASYDKLHVLLDGLPTGESTVEDVYGYCQQITTYSSDWNDKLESLEALNDENVAPYIKAADDYTTSVTAMAIWLTKYIDEEDHEAYQKAKDTSTLIPIQDAAVKQARKDYLTASGLAEEEINTIIANG